MSQGWSKLQDAGLLADRGEEFEFSIPVKEFPRLAVQAPGVATGRVRFGRDQGLAVADVRVRAETQLTCQRCLGPMPWHIDSTGRAAIVADAAEAERVPAHLETVLAPDRRLSLRDLVEEELLLSWPLVPRHEESACSADTRAAGTAVHHPDTGRAETHRPFAQLPGLFKRR